MAAAALPTVTLVMPLDDDLISAVGAGVQLERAINIQMLRNQKVCLDTLQAMQGLLAVQKLSAGSAPSGTTLGDALKALQSIQPQAAQIAPGGATVAVQKAA